ncbi:MAG: gamma-glutamyltransferase [Chloroflexi bacterium]|nr:gamma-glutamyltransferase [Chloroflexota bacterium]MYK61996.1 gamma-glutamyltransferase [Chloroflexota bacterium]
MNTHSVYRPDKDEVVVEHGAVATAHPVAAQVGVDILKSGGNAVDAAIATGFCLNVVEPASSSIAGHGQMIVYIAAERRTVAIDYGHRAPQAATPDTFRVIGQAVTGNGIYEVEEQANAIGHRSAGVPGVTAGMCRAHELFGSLPLELLLEPAVHYARQGFEADPSIRLQIASNMPNLARYKETARVFMPDGYPPPPGAKVVQRDLADTLERISKKGKNALHKGEIAAAIDEEMRRNDGLLTARDLAEYEAEVRHPVNTHYRGYELLTCPVTAGTITTLQTLNILENFDLREHGSPEHLHLFIEAARHAFADRYSFVGDPEFVPVPFEGLLSKDYARHISNSIDTDTANLEHERELQPWVAYIDNPLHDPWNYDPQPRPDQALSASPPSEGDCTTHFSVIDRDRNMVACTQTAVGGFGSSVIVPGTGVLLSNGMVVFNPKPGAANSIAGFKRGLNNMSPVVALKNSKSFLTVGAPGGRRIICRIAHVISNVIDFGMTMQEAITAPSVDAAERETFIDHRIDSQTVETLARMGHNVSVVPEPSTGGGFSRPRGVMIDPDTGLLHAGVHPFGPDEARGY